MHLKLLVYVIIVNFFHNQQKQNKTKTNKKHKNRIFLGIFAKILKS